jgi:hypothetical protein
MIAFAVFHTPLMRPAATHARLVAREVECSSERRVLIPAGPTPWSPQRDPRLHFLALTAGQPALEEALQYVSG